MGKDVPDELARLIARYRWLQQEGDREGVIAGPKGEEASLASSLDTLFLAIVKYPTDDPRISYRQIAFLLDAMAASTDPKVRGLLRDEVLAHVKRLANRLELEHGRPPQPPLHTPAKGTGKPGKRRQLV